MEGKMTDDSQLDLFSFGIAKPPEKKPEPVEAAGYKAFKAWKASTELKEEKEDSEVVNMPDSFEEDLKWGLYNTIDAEASEKELNQHFSDIKWQRITTLTWKLVLFSQNITVIVSFYGGVSEPQLLRLPKDNAVHIQIPLTHLVDKDFINLLRIKTATRTKEWVFGDNRYLMDNSAAVMSEKAGMPRFK